MVTVDSCFNRYFSLIYCISTTVLVSNTVNINLVALLDNRLSHRCQTLHSLRCSRPVRTFCAGTLFLWACPIGSVPFWPSSSWHSVFVALLLLTSGDIKLNPGSCIISTRFLGSGSLNCRSAVNKAAPLNTIIDNHQLDILAFQQMWFQSHASLAITSGKRGFNPMHRWS